MAASMTAAAAAVGPVRQAAAAPRRAAASAAVAAAPPAPQRRSLLGGSRSSAPGAAARQAVVAAASAADAAEVFPIPRGPSETVQQAAEACKRAWAAGIKRQRVELLLPLIGASDLDDWPGGIRQQFKAASPMVEELLRELKKLPGLEGPLNARILDDGDAVAAWEGASLAAVLFPTGETLGEVRKIAEARKDGLVIIVNPQWSSEGSNVISDLGFLPWQRAANVELVGSFHDTYILKQLRMSSDDVRLLRSYPSPWQVNLSRPEAPGQTECVARTEARPTYKQLEAILRGVDWSMSSKPIGERLAYEARWTQRSLESLPESQRFKDREQ